AGGAGGGGRGGSGASPASPYAEPASPYGEPAVTAARGAGGAPRAVGIVPHPQRASAAAERAARLLTDARAEVRVPAPLAEAIGLSDLAHDPETFATGLDFVLSLGGDGTMLRTVDLVAAEGVPVLGVNLGQMGFLTELEPAQLEDGLRRALAGGCQISER